MRIKPARRADSTSEPSVGFILSVGTRLARVRVGICGTVRGERGAGPGRWDSTTDGHEWTRMMTAGGSTLEMRAAGPDAHGACPDIGDCFGVGGVTSPRAGLGRGKAFEPRMDTDDSDDLRKSGVGAPRLQQGVGRPELARCRDAPCARPGWDVRDRAGWGHPAYRTERTRARRVPTSEMGWVWARGAGGKGRAHQPA